MQGGISIPDNSDLNDYIKPGNYYCNSSLSAGTISNNPFDGIAFVLKVSYSTGNDGTYIMQTIQRYTDGVIQKRVRMAGSWTEWKIFSDDATVLGQTITYSTYSIYENQTMTIEENDNSFYQLIVFRGSIGSGYNAVLLTGYGIGTDSRYHYKLLDDGSAISISISDTSFVIKNEVQSGLTARIFNLYGNSPTVSIS